MAIRAKKKIVVSGNEDYVDHRNDFESCPSCDHVMDGGEWDKVATTLVLGPRYYKSGCITVISECPKCFATSWVHHPIDTFGYADWPESWKKAVAVEEKKLKLAALRTWGEGICHQCKHLVSATIDYHPWRQCILGGGPAETKCDKFASYKKAS